MDGVSAHPDASLVELSQARAALARVEDLLSRYEGYVSEAYVSVKAVRAALAGDAQ